MLIQWSKLPACMRTDEVRPYYDALHKRRVFLIIKRMFDLLAGLVLLVVLSPIMAGIWIAVVLDSPGGGVFAQRRVTRCGRQFSIYKFRTMYKGSESSGALTIEEDSRITPVGGLLRRCRLDELPQLVNIIMGEMSFVGTRPELPVYVDCYTAEMLATLLLPAGLTSKASVEFRGEAALIDSDDPCGSYVRDVLPQKMGINLEYLLRCSLKEDAGVLFKTLVKIFL